MITKYPPTAVPAYNEIIVEDNENTSIRVAETGGTGRETTLHHVRQNGVARFDLKNFVSKLFRDAVTVIPTQGRPGWAFTDNRLQAGFTVGGRNHVGVNAVQRKGETLDLFDYGEHGALTLRPVENNVIRIPKYGGFPVGVSAMYKDMYQPYGAPTAAQVETTKNGVEIGLPWYFTGNASGGGMVDWGDGMVEPFTCQSLNLSTIMRHTYAAPGQYHITWSPAGVKCYIHGAGDLPGTPGFAASLLGYDAFSDRIVYMSHRGNTAMAYINEGMPGRVVQADINNHFRDCFSLTTVPPGYFDPVAGFIASAVSAFENTRSFTDHYLIQLLTASMWSLTDATRMFYGSGITGADSYMFRGFWIVQNVTEMFAYSGMKDIEVDAFNWKLVERVDSMFEGCVDLKTVPDDIFSHFSRVKSFRRVFAGCTKLIEVGRVFSNCGNVEVFEMAFYNCPALIFVKTELFENNVKAINYDYCFAVDMPGGGNIQTLSPQNPGSYRLWQLAGLPGYPAAISGTACFRGQTRMVDYADVPAGWK